MSSCLGLFCPWEVKGCEWLAVMGRRFGVHQEQPEVSVAAHSRVSEE